MLPSYCENPVAHQDEGCAACALSSYGRDCHNNVIVDGRAKAEFRALREDIGMSQQYLAALTGVTVSTVKRWENPAYFAPPLDAWQTLDEFKARQDEIVKFSVAKAMELDVEIGSKPQEVTLTYYRTQEQYDAFGKDEGDYGVANANSRAVAAALVRSGYSVRFEYPE